MKKFIIKTLIYFIPFCCVYAGYKIFSQYYISGDSGGLGKIPFGKEYNKYLEQNYLSDNLTIDTFVISNKKLQVPNASKIFTIGDSFSDQGMFGYQNYLAHLLTNKVVNIERIGIYAGTNFKTIIGLLNSGIIDSTTCKIIIFEQVDRYAIGGLMNIDFNTQYEFSKDGNNHKKGDTDKDSELYDLCSSIRLLIGYDNPVLKCDLKQEYFTHKRFSRKLFYYIDDMDFLTTSKAEIEKAKENLILLDKKFSEKGIKMIFLIASDKYDVYRPFVTDDSLPIDTTTDGLSNLPDVCIINTKSMLQDMVRNGEKDVYMVNDTHWSYKASKVIAQKLFQTILDIR